MSIQETRVQVFFSQETAHGTYTDALYFAPEEYDQTTPEEISALINDRVSDWVATIETTSQE